MFTIGLAVSASHNDQVKPAGNDYVNVKPVWPVCVCVATMLQKRKNTKFIYITYIFINIYKIYAVYIYI